MPHEIAIFVENQLVKGSLYDKKGANISSGVVPVTCFYTFGEAE